MEIAASATHFSNDRIKTYSVERIHICRVVDRSYRVETVPEIEVQRLLRFAGLPRCEVIENESTKRAALGRIPQLVSTVMLIA